MERRQPGRAGRAEIARESGTRGIGFRLFYPIFRRISDLPSAPDAGIFGLMDRRVIDEFNKLPGAQIASSPACEAGSGSTRPACCTIATSGPHGKPKQTLRKLIKYAMDGMISFSYKPLRAATYLGFLVSIAAFGLGLFYIVTFFALAKAGDRIHDDHRLRACSSAACN